MISGEKEGKKPRGYQAGLVVCVVIIVVLGFWGSTLLNQINTLNADKTNLQNQIDELNKIVGLQKSQVVVSEKTVNQGPNSVTVVVGLSFPYCGYVHISSTSTTSNAYIIVQYWFQGKLYSFKETAGTSGDKIFPVLKSDMAAIYIGNTNWLDGATHTVTITYYY